MTDEDLKKMGDEFERFLNPVYEQLDRIEKTQGKHTDKIDALTGDVITLQKQVGSLQDKTTVIDEKLTRNIEQNRGLPPFSSDPN